MPVQLLYGHHSSWHAQRRGFLQDGDVSACDIREAPACCRGTVSAGSSGLPFYIQHATILLSNARPRCQVVVVIHLTTITTSVGEYTVEHVWVWMFGAFISAKFSSCLRFNLYQLLRLWRPFPEQHLPPPCHSQALLGTFTRGCRGLHSGEHVIN